MSNHNIPQENKQSRLMDTVDRIDDKFPNLGKVTTKIGGVALILGLLTGGAAIYNETGPRTTIDEKVVDVGPLDYSQARNVVLGDTEKLADKHGIELHDITGVTDTTSSLMRGGEQGYVQLSKKPLDGYVVSAETTSSDPANIPSQSDQQNQ